MVSDPYGLARPEGAGPCEPAAWVEVDVDGDARDLVVEDGGRCMWRIVDENGVPHAYAYVRHKAVELPSLHRIDGDPLSGWERETNAEKMIILVTELFPVPVSTLAAIALARGALCLVAPGEDRPRLAIDAAEACVRCPNESTRDAALRAAEQVWRVRGRGWAVRAAADLVHAATTEIGDMGRRDIERVSWIRSAANAVVTGFREAAGFVAPGAAFPDPVKAVFLAEQSGGLAALVRGVIPTRAIFDALVRKASP